MPVASRAGSRAPAVLLAAEYVHTLPSCALLLVALSAWAERSDGSVRTAGLVVVLLVLTLRLVAPVYGWWSVTYAIDDAGVSVTKGLLARRTRTVVWSRVKSVEATRPWYLRLFKLNSVVLIQSGDESARVVLRAVPDGDPLLLRLLALADSEPGVAAQETPATAGTLDDAVPETSVLAQETPIHALGRRDLIFVSLAYGQAFLLAPVVLMTVWEAIDTVGLTGSLGAFTERFGVVLVGVAAAFVAVVLGIVGTVVRFHGFRVSAARDGRLAIRYGLIETRERVVDPGAVVGVVVQRNILERLMGRARLSVVTRDTSGGLGTSVIVPSVSLVVVDTLVRKHLSRFRTEMTYRAEGRGALVRSGVSTLTLIAVPAGVFGLMELVFVLPVVWAAVAALVSLALLRAIGALVAARLHFDPVAGVVVHTTLFSVERVTTVTASSLHGVATWQRPGRRAGSPMLATCHLYTGRARRLVALRSDWQQLDALRAVMVDRSDVGVSAGRTATSG